MHIKLSSVSQLLQAFALVFSEIESTIEAEIATQKPITDSTVTSVNNAPVS